MGRMLRHPRSLARRGAIVSARYTIRHSQGESTFGTLTIAQRGQNGLFRVTYGLQVKEGLTYEQAAHEFGECLFHWLACEAKIGNIGP
jgi:hypothetical protein